MSLGYIMAALLILAMLFFIYSMKSKAVFEFPSMEIDDILPIAKTVRREAIIYLSNKHDEQFSNYILQSVSVSLVDVTGQFCNIGCGEGFNVYFEFNHKTLYLFKFAFLKHEIYESEDFFFNPRSGQVMVTTYGRPEIIFWNQVSLWLSLPDSQDFLEGQASMMEV